jgi:hypothetical protein
MSMWNKALVSAVAAMVSVIAEEVIRNHSRRR